MMRIEFRLRQILDAHNVPAHGRIQMIARETGLHHLTITKIYNNTSTTVTLATLDRICAWLQKRGWGEGLPGRLLGFRPSELLEAMIAPGRVKFWLGEYREQRPQGVVRARDSRDDFSVAAGLIERLCGLESKAPGAGGVPRPQLSFEYGHLPIHVAAGGSSLDASMVEQDRRAGEHAARLLGREPKPGTSVLIGSQLANYLQECFVAGMFRCPPYRAADNSIPFYLRFQEPAPVPSCFGGNTAPSGADDSGQAGIYYRHRGERRWKFFPSVPLKQGTGIVIVRRNPDLVGLELSVFGLTGIATAAMGKLLCDMPDRFWPKEGPRGGLQPAVYVCGFQLVGMEAWEQDIDSVVIGPPEIVALDVDVPRRRR